MKKLLFYAILCFFCHINTYSVEKENHLKNLLIVIIQQLECESAYGDKVDEKKIRKALTKLLDIKSFYWALSMILSPGQKLPTIKTGYIIIVEKQLLHNYWQS